VGSEDGKKVARVYGGENWNPDLQAPLTHPGVNVAAGEYLLAVNGREVRAGESLYSFFEGTAGKQVALKVGPNPDGTGAREVTVVPVENEYGLRNRAWIEENRRTVDRLSGGRVAYIYLPDTGQSGYTAFNRYYFAQSGKESAVIDERFNGGRVRRRLHHRLPAAPPPELLEAALRRGRDDAGPGDLRSQGDADPGRK